MEILNIEKEKAINAYRVGSDEQKQVLELLFGVETLKPKTVMDRVKTFEDALKELKPFHPLVKEYKALRKADVTSNLIAYSKLCIVTAALNEGWTPKFIKGEKRYSPCFFLYTDKEIRNMSKEEKSSVVYRPNYGTYENGGMAYEIAKDGSASFFATFMPLLVFKTSELAEYAGKQFVYLYADYLLKA